MNFAALRYEELTLNAFPVLHTEVYDGWILRFTEGGGLRGNCVTPLYLSTRSYEDKIIYCEKKFASRSLPAVFKMTANVSGALDQQLAMAGYEMTGKTRILECRLGGLAEKASPHIPAPSQADPVMEQTTITLSHSLDDKWLEAFLELDDGAEEKERSCDRSMLDAVRNPVYCAAVYEGRTPAGCGLGVVEDGKVGLYDIRVRNTLRRHGIGAAICRAIMEEGVREGADTAYLQTDAHNFAALSLYESLGFQEVYTYWYRVKPVSAEASDRASEAARGCR